MTKKNPKVKFITLGCRVNQYETQSMREALSREGFLTVSSAASGNDDDHLRKAGGRKISEADFVVINTCTVTGEADRESRYWIRRARREHPKARIVVTGCGVERDRPAIRIMSEVDRLVPNTEKPEIARHLLTDGEEPPCSEMSGTEEKKRGYPPLSISCSEGKTRAFIKIQDGCNHACSFCKVVLVRGGSRSRPPDDVLREVERLRDAGYRDVVFTWIQLGAYGRDLSEKRLCALPRLLETCSRIEGIERLRLSSIEPTDIEPDMISALRGIPKCMPHLHVPLQSGDDEILRRMNRRYDSRFYSDLVERLRSEIPDFTLTLDVMAGLDRKSVV